jgi:hypothetical protein
MYIKVILYSNPVWSDIKHILTVLNSKKVQLNQLEKMGPTPLSGRTYFFRMKRVFEKTHLLSRRKSDYINPKLVKSVM